MRGWGCVTRQVVDLAVRVGADLEEVDNSNRTCFSNAAKQLWYDKMEPALAREAWTNVATGYQSHLFQDARTQLAVQRRWELDIQGKVYMRLCCWVLFIFLVMTVAVWQTGRDGHYARGIQAGFEETILFDEYGAHHSGFWDMRNDGELQEWLTEVLGPNMYVATRHLPQGRWNLQWLTHQRGWLCSYEGMGRYRDGGLDAKDQTEWPYGAIYSFNYLVGRPRIRTIRSKVEPCAGIRSYLEPFNKTVCFERLVDSEEETRPFKTGSYVGRLLGSAVVPAAVGTCAPMCVYA